MRRYQIFWGGFLILLGIMLLLDQLGLVRFGQLWPLLLVAIGGWMIWRNTSGRSATAETETLSIPLEGATQAHLKLSHGAGRLQITANAEEGNLLDGAFDNGVIHHIRRSGDQLDVTLRANPLEPFEWIPGSQINWSIGLNRDTALTLDLHTGASRADLDLSKLKVQRIHLNSGANDTQITLPAHAGHTDFKIDAGAASVSVQAPDGVAVRLKSTGLLSTSVDQQRFPRSGKYYQSPDYDTAENRVNLKVAMGAGTLKLH